MVETKDQHVNLLLDRIQYFAPILFTLVLHIAKLYACMYVTMCMYTAN